MLLTHTITHTLQHHGSVVINCHSDNFDSSMLYVLCGSLHPRYDQAMNNLGNLYKDRGQLLEAEDLLSKAVHIRYSKLSHTHSWSCIGTRLHLPGCLL